MMFIASIFLYLSNTCTRLFGAVGLIMRRLFSKIVLLWKLTANQCENKFKTKVIANMTNQQLTNLSK